MGSSLFLKRRFGVGYNLTLVKKEKGKQNTVTEHLETELGPDIKKLSEISTEITYQIPTDYAPKFKNFFIDFDQRLGDFNIEGYGISITTLEEVFLRVGDGKDVGDHFALKQRLREKMEGKTTESLEDDPEKG